MDQVGRSFSSWFLCIRCGAKLRLLIWRFYEGLSLQVTNPIYLISPAALHWSSRRTGGIG
jgi:hypothetical protein